MFDPRCRQSFCLNLALLKSLIAAVPVVSSTFLADDLDTPLVVDLATLNNGAVFKFSRHIVEEAPVFFQVIPKGVETCNMSESIVMKREDNFWVGIFMQVLLFHEHLPRTLDVCEQNLDENSDLMYSYSLSEQDVTLAIFPLSRNSSNREMIHYFLAFRG